jgi:glycosyltransferase involved in cell wall biosynthesis
MSDSTRFCAVIPTFDNPRTIRNVVLGARAHLEAVIVVDDGSGSEARRAAEELSEGGLARVVFREKNGGKGSAVKAGFVAARNWGYSHVLQVDADGQHDMNDIPRFLEVACANPEALVLGAPVFDESAPKIRLMGRKITQGLTHIETFGRAITDPMCGLRVYPIEAAIRAGAKGNAMDFDPEVAVRMVWNGTRVINLPTRVRYVSADDGGVSHFRMGMDNLLLSWMHARLLLGALLRGVRPGPRRGPPP